MKTLKKIQQRNSARILIDPKPSDDELNEIYKAALRAPDHAWLRPTKFIQVMESGLDKLSDIFEKVAIETKDKIPKYRTKTLICSSCSEYITSSR